MADVLRVDSDDGGVTRYASAFRERDVFATQRHTHQVVEVTGALATRASVRAELAGRSFGLVTASGHGTFFNFLGSDGKAVWDFNDVDLDLLSGAIVHFLACQAGAALGGLLERNGVRAFWGYTVDFKWMRLTIPLANLADDDEAEPFFAPDVVIDNGILSGMNAEEIHDAVSGRVTKQLMAWNHSSDAARRALLLANYMGLAWPGMSWGDPGATL